MLRVPFPSAQRALILVFTTALVTLVFVAHHHPDEVETVRTYLVQSSTPFTSWGDSDQGVLPDPLSCSVQTGMLDIEDRWGDLALRMSVAHEGSGARVRRVLDKLIKGERIVIGIVGGSITYGHGLGKDQRAWPETFTDRLLEQFPDSEIIVHSGAVPATGTDYFSACFEKHVPEDTDLYIVEAAVNDILTETKGGPSLADTVDFTEMLVREMLSKGEDKAVIMLSTWSPLQLFINGADHHAIVSEYYDVPRISSRSFLYPYLIQHTDEIGEHYAGTDKSHQGEIGHEYLADIMAHYLFSQMCQVETSSTDWNSLPTADDIKRHRQDLKTGYRFTSAYDPFAIPPVRIKQRLTAAPLPEGTPFCSSANARLQDGSPELKPSSTDGFEELTYNDKHYWAAETPGSSITFDNIEVNGGAVSVYYLRSSNNGLGNLFCWVDSDRNAGAVLKGTWQYVSVGSVGVVANNVAKGTHSVSCEVMSDTDAPEGTFKARIIAILAS